MAIMKVLSGKTVNGYTSKKSLITKRPKDNPPFQNPSTTIQAIWMKTN
jgi:hypothetical protein